MKHYTKTAISTILGLGFVQAEDDRALRGKDRSIFTHAYEPETRLTISHKGSEARCRTTVQRARQIVGLADAEVDKPKPKTVSREKTQRAAERDRRAAATATADARRAQEEAERLASQRRSQVSGLDRMMRGGSSAPSPVKLRGEWISPQQLADETGLTDGAIRHAIDNERMDLYQVGAKKMLKTDQAMDWARKSMGRSA